MKRYAYTFVLFFLMTAGASAQIKIGNHTFKNGAEYSGELKGKKPNGKGRTVFKSGDIYEGEYVKGKRQGSCSHQKTACARIFFGRSE